MQAIADFLDGISDLITIHELDGSILCMTPSVNRFAGTGKSSATLEEILVVVHEHDRPAVRRAFDAWANGPMSTTPTLHFRARCADGSYQMMTAIGRRFRNEHGQLRIGVTTTQCHAFALAS